MLRILHVEDNADFRSFFRTFIKIFAKEKNKKIDVKSIGNIKDAKETLLNNIFDIIVIDGSIESNHDSIQLAEFITNNQILGIKIIFSGDKNFPKTSSEIIDYFVFKENGAHNGINRIKDIIAAKF